MEFKVELTEYEEKRLRELSRVELRTPENLIHYLVRIYIESNDDPGPNYEV